MYRNIFLCYIICEKCEPGSCIIGQDFFSLITNTFIIRKFTVVHGNCKTGFQRNCNPKFKRSRTSREKEKQIHSKAVFSQIMISKK